MIVGMLVGVGFLTLGCEAKQTVATNDPNSKENPTFGIPVSKGGTSVVKGKVTAGDEPIIAGRVLLFVEDGLCLTVGVINADGTYECANVPDGKAEAVVLLDPDGGLPFPTTAPGAGGMPGGGPPGGGMPGGGPPGGGMPGGGRPGGGMPGGGPPGGGMPGGGPPGGMKGGPMGKGAGAMQPGPQSLPPPFLDQLTFQVPRDKTAAYKVLHQKYGKSSKNNPLSFTVSGSTTFDIILK